jgi:hypothetical protein
MKEKEVRGTRWDEEKREKDVDDEYKRTYPHGGLEVVRHRRRFCFCRLTPCQWRRQQILQCKKRPCRQEENV